MRLMRRHQTCRPIHAVKHRWRSPCYFTQKHTFETLGQKLHVLLIAFGSECSRERAKVPGSKSSRERKFLGAKVPGSESSRERKFHVTFAPGSESSRDRKFQGAKVPGSESSTYGTFALGSESTWERKFQLPFAAYLQFFLIYLNLKVEQYKSLLWYEVAKIVHTVHWA